jgi:hypothetical protein
LNTRLFSVFPLKGSYPQTMAYNITPIAQMSQAGATAFFYFSKTSGGK